ncbi:MAG: HNH endonuclease [Bacteroidales bacterium]|nr:HNH endonuclease [Bacteroidales bacterium]
MRKRAYTIEDVKKAVANNQSIAGVLRQLGLKPLGGNYRTINSIISEHGIDTSHFTGKGWNVGLAFKPNKGASESDIFVRDSAYKCSWRLREHYKKLTGIHCCERCKLEIWQGHPIPLEIHHINGDSTDNRLSNLILLCPNCHALTNNYRGRAKLSARSERTDAECRKFKEALTGKADGNLEPSL